MTISDEQLLELQAEFKAEYPFIYTDYPDNTEDTLYQWEEEQVNNTLALAVEEIPNYCKKWKEIAKALTLHKLLLLKKEEEALTSGDIGADKDIKSVKALGDMSVTYNNPNSYERFNPLFDSDKWGQKARLLLKECTKSRLGLIV
jgi:hypothetical protein